MYRTIWFYYFITGLLSFTAGVPVLDDWATALIPQPGSATCSIAGQATALTRADVSLCLAAGFNEVRVMAGLGLGTLFNIHGDMRLAEWLHVADVLMILVGVVAAAIAMIWVWANGMTRLAAVSLTGTYTLCRAVSMVLDRGASRA